MIAPMPKITAFTTEVTGTPGTRVAVALAAPLRLTQEGRKSRVGVTARTAFLPFSSAPERAHW